MCVPYQKYRTEAPKRFKKGKRANAITLVVPILPCGARLELKDSHLGLVSLRCSASSVLGKHCKSLRPNFLPCLHLGCTACHWDHGACIVCTKRWTAYYWDHAACFVCLKDALHALGTTLLALSALEIHCIPWDYAASLWVLEVHCMPLRPCYSPCLRLRCTVSFETTAHVLFASDMYCIPLRL